MSARRFFPGEGQVLVRCFPAGRHIKNIFKYTKLNPLAGYYGRP